MDIKRIDSSALGISLAQNYDYSLNQTSTKNYGLRLSNPIQADAVSFSARPILSPKKKMAAYALKLLKEKGLKENQPLWFSADSKYIPFISALTDEAYKKGSGLIYSCITEPEFEALRKKYKITKDFNYVAKAGSELERKGALYLEFNDENCPYRAAGLTKDEIKQQIANIMPKIPKRVQSIFELDPEEIFKTAMDIKKGQPVYISCNREHMPQVVKLVDWLYSQNKTKLVDIVITEQKEFNDDVSFFKYAKSRLIGKYNQSSIAANKEMYKKDTAELYLCGDDPKIYEGLNSKKILMQSRRLSKVFREYYDRSSRDIPWLIYYVPTTKSARYAYPEYGDNEIAALAHANRDAKKINRVGKLVEHMNSIEARAKKLNDVLDKGFRTMHYVSVNPVTKKPDGKTDLKVKLSSKSIFGGARAKMEKYGHNPIENVPSEEIYTSPLANSAEGVVTATKPLVLKGKVVDGIKMTFHKGRAIKISASRNQDMFKEYIRTNKNADRLGEVALVAGSPIAKSGRLFYETLLDENVTCHVALGDAFSEVITGSSRYKNYLPMQSFLKRQHINTSHVHDDFMIGGPNVYVYAENSENGERIPLIINDKFVL